jgi:hypothetical protein
VFIKLVFLNNFFLNLEKEKPDGKQKFLFAYAPALRIAAVILFERYEQKDKSGKPDPTFSWGNARI